MMPVITKGGLEMMRWGLIPKWANDEKIGYKVLCIGGSRIIN